MKWASGWRVAIGAVAMAIAMAVAAATPTAAASKVAAGKDSAASTARRDADDLVDFDRRAKMSRDLGATEMVVTDGLPIARWEEDPDDPYPAWFAHHATLFKMFPPQAVRPFVDGAYAARVRNVVARRCQILAKYDLKAIWSANEPGVLPEAFFAAHPDYRGPRIDQVTRSRKTYFAPNVANPEVLAMYREATTDLLSVCPQLETFLWVTTDAGSGFDWAPGLYPGANGASENRDQPLADRVVRFMTNIQQAAAQSGHRVRIEINQIPPRPWMIATFGPDVLENIQRQLPAGLAVNGREGPDGRPFETGLVRIDDGAFSPVVGLVVPSFDPVATLSGAHKAYLFGDRESEDFAFRLLLSTRDQPMSTAAGRLAALRRFAVSEVGDARADTLIDAWSALNDVRKYLAVLDFGPMLRMGHVLNRWIERPMVPYPAELTDAEKAGWRRFLSRRGAKTRRPIWSISRRCGCMRGGVPTFYFSGRSRFPCRASGALGRTSTTSRPPRATPGRRTIGGLPRTASRRSVICSSRRTIWSGIRRSSIASRPHTRSRRPTPCWVHRAIGRAPT